MNGNNDLENEFESEYGMVVHREHKNNERKGIIGILCQAICDDLGWIYGVAMIPYPAWIDLDIVQSCVYEYDH